ncbi:MAG: iron-containing alcohol dehydrogenase [Bacteroidales bacterium]|nr:iron-containing alcohol dehydrogenase [Bacteroidales bacterium]
MSEELKMGSMQGIVFNMPPRLQFGNGGIEALVQECRLLNQKRLFILTIPALKPMLEQKMEELVSEGVEVCMDCSLEMEPSYADFYRILNTAETFEASGVIGVGGGSVMDVAKLVAAMLGSDCKLEEVVGIDLLKGRSTWLACVPSTAGTGSEVSPNAILMDEGDGGAKKGIVSRWLVPDAAFVDPALTIGVPAGVTAATGMDALTHCLEAYVNRFAHPMTNLYALEGIRLIASSLQQAVNNGKDLEARTAVALGSLYGGMCLGPVNTAAVHALAYPLGSKYGIAHGLSNAVMLPAVMRYNIQAEPQIYAEVAQALGVAPESDWHAMALKGVQVIENLMVACGIDGHLTTFGIRKEDLPELASEGMKVQRLLKNNPRAIKYEDALAIYSSLMQ